jgi:hypothetical protein
MKLRFAFRGKIYRYLTMKHPISCLCVLIGGSLCATAAIIERDFTADQVVDMLGKPMGIIELKDKTLYLYPQGDVTFRSNITL